MVCLYLKNRDVYFRKLDVDQTTRPALVSCRGKRVTLSVDERQRDLDFCDLIQESLGTDGLSSTIYLVGDGFSQEWAKKSVVLLCKAQRKVATLATISMQKVPARRPVKGGRGQTAESLSVYRRRRCPVQCGYGSF